MNEQPFDVAGPADAPAVVLMHGVTTSRKTFLEHAPLLADRYRVIALDLPGHGSLADLPFRLDSAAELLRGVIEAEAGGRALVVGDSLGGYVSMAFSASYPQLAAGLVLASCTLSMQGVVGMAAKAGAELMSLGVWSRFGWSGLASVYDGTRQPPLLSFDGLLLRATLLEKVGPDVFRELAGEDFEAAIRRFPGPILFLNGELDLVFRMDERRFLTAARDARLRIIDLAGHAASLERPDAWVESVRGFATSIGW